MLLTFIYDKQQIYSILSDKETGGAPRRGDTIRIKTEKRGKIIILQYLVAYVVWEYNEKTPGLEPIVEIHLTNSNLHV